MLLIIWLRVSIVYTAKEQWNIPKVKIQYYKSKSNWQSYCKKKKQKQKQTAAYKTEHIKWKKVNQTPGVLGWLERIGWSFSVSGLHCVALVNTNLVISPILIFVTCLWFTIRNIDYWKLFA